MAATMGEMSSEPTQVVLELLHAARKQDVEAILSLLDDGIVWTSPPLPPFRGKASAQRALRILMRVLRSFDYREDQWAQVRETVFVERTELLGIGPFVVELPVASTFRVVDGRIHTWSDYYDPSMFPVRLVKAMVAWLAARISRGREDRPASTSNLYWPETQAVPKLRRSWSTILRLLPKIATYAANPFRLSAAQSMSEFVCAVAAPRFQREFEAFAATPGGRIRVQERSDLSAILDDHKVLEELPEGTLGREYVGFVRGAYMGDTGADGTMSGATSFLDILGIDEAAQRMGWPGEYVWYLRRMTLTHDLTHVFTGYGTDNAGEFANIAYTAGHFRIHALLPIVLASMVIVKPEQGRRAWCRYLWAAYQRGRHQREQLSRLDYEALLELPMDEVLRRIGISPFDEAHPDGRIDDELGFKNLNLQAMMES